jgi:hypothetical protein
MPMRLLPGFDGAGVELQRLSHSLRENDLHRHVRLFSLRNPHLEPALRLIVLVGDLHPVDEEDVAFPVRGDVPLVEDLLESSAQPSRDLLGRRRRGDAHAGFPLGEFEDLPARLGVQGHLPIAGGVPSSQFADATVPRDRDRTPGDRALVQGTDRRGDRLEP